MTKDIDISGAWFVNDIAFSPDGKTLASAGGDDTIKLWNLESGNDIITLSRRRGTVNSVAFSSDGKTLASGSDGKTIKIWEVDYFPDLPGYLIGEWYTFDEETGELRPTTTVAYNFHEYRGVGFLNVGPWTHAGVLQGAKTFEEQNRQLQNHYLYGNQAWLGAFALLDQPMDEEPDATLLASHAAELLTQDDQQGRARIFFDRLRVTKWGRQHLASTEMIDLLNINDTATVSWKQLLLEANQPDG